MRRETRGRSVHRRAARAAALAIVCAGLAACSGGGSRPEPVAPRPATPLSKAEILARLGLQPALDRVSPGSAWRAGWNGRGVVIGVEDSPVDLTHPEFAGRAVWKRSWPLYGYLDFAALCAGRTPACRVTDADSERDVRATAREIVESEGWPSVDDSRFVRHVGGGATGDDVWYEVPAVGQPDTRPGALAGRFALARDPGRGDRRGEAQRRRAGRRWSRRSPSRAGPT